jgi:hypothetical protein
MHEGIGIAIAGASLAAAPALALEKTSARVIDREVWSASVRDTGGPSASIPR